MNIKLIENAYNSVGQNLNPDTQEKFFFSVLGLYERLLGLRKSLITTEEAIKQDLNLVDLQDDQIVFLEELDSFSEFKELAFIGNSSPFEEDGHNEHFRNAVMTSKNVLETISDIVLAGSIMSDTAVEKLRKPIDFILGELIYCLLYSFGLYSVHNAISKGERVEVQVQVMKVVESRGLELAALASAVVSNSEVYRAKLKVFESMPELEEVFYEAVGTYFEQFLYNESYLTEEFVARVIAKDSDLESIFEDFLAHVKKEKANEIIVQ